MRTIPFFGEGVAFPFRINSKGGVQTTKGNADNTSVPLQYFNERWTIREDPAPKANHIAEGIAHILLTRRTEHDTLPEFGSDLFFMVFEPNTREFQLQAAHYLRFSTIRWEKRARIPEEQSIAFYFEGRTIDQGRLPMIARVEFITQQVEGNLVAPFVTPRQARLQEYQSNDFDSSGHDYESRYYGATVVERDGIRFNRFRKRKYYSMQQDDEFYKVQYGDTWLLISHAQYGDIRYWPVLAEMYIQDLAADGATRSIMDPCPDPEPGQYIRIPSRTRVFMELSTLHN